MILAALGARFVASRRIAVPIAATVANPAASMQLGLPNDSTAARSFGEGANGPLAIVVDLNGSTDRQTALQQAATAGDSASYQSRPDANKPDGA